MTKLKKFTIFLLLLLIPFFINLGLLITDKFAGKSVQIGSFFYSNLSNELWLNFWGNYLSGFLAFLLIFHYQEQLELEKNLKKQEICLKEIVEERNVVKELLKKWDNSMFDEYKDFIQDYIIFEEKNKIKVDRIEKINLDSKIFKIKEKIQKTLNIDFLDVEFLDLRIQDEEILNNIKNNEEYKNLYDKGIILYNYICDLRTNINTLNTEVADKIVKYQQNEIDIMQLCLVIKKIHENQNEISKLVVIIINLTCEYYQMHKKLILNNNFSMRMNKI